MDVLTFVLTHYVLSSSFIGMVANTIFKHLPACGTDDLLQVGLKTLILIGIKLYNLMNMSKGIEYILTERPKAVKFTKIAQQLQDANQQVADIPESKAPETDPGLPNIM